MLIIASRMSFASAILVARSARSVGRHGVGRPPLIGSRRVEEKVEASKDNKAEEEEENDDVSGKYVARIDCSIKPSRCGRRVPNSLSSGG